MAFGLFTASPLALCAFRPHTRVILLDIIDLRTVCGPVSSQPAREDRETNSDAVLFAIPRSFGGGRPSGPGRPVVLRPV